MIGQSKSRREVSLLLEHPGCSLKLRMMAMAIGASCPFIARRVPQPASRSCSGRRSGCRLRSQAACRIHQPTARRLVVLPSGSWSSEAGAECAGRVRQPINPDRREVPPDARIFVLEAIGSACLIPSDLRRLGQEISTRYYWRFNRSRHNDCPKIAHFPHGYRGLGTSFPSALAAHRPIY